MRKIIELTGKACESEDLSDSHQYRFNQMPLSNARLFKRFKATEDFDGVDPETVISLIDAMIAKQQMQTTLVSLDDQAATG